MGAKLMRDIRPTKTRPRRAEARRGPEPMALNPDKWDICKTDVNDLALPTDYDTRHIHQ